MLPVGWRGSPHLDDRTRDRVEVPDRVAWRKAPPQELVVTRPNGRGITPGTPEG